MDRAPLHTVAEHSTPLLSYVVSNNRSTSCDCIVHSLLTNRKIELRTNVVEALGELETTRMMFRSSREVTFLGLPVDFFLPY
uniref:Uncharacterized protein n=1 Tax=Caenorhabditis japonica TaxID=281687 RepID=A0A8R1EHW5_CAEJA